MGIKNVNENITTAERGDVTDLGVEGDVFQWWNGPSSGVLTLAGVTSHVVELLSAAVSPWRFPSRVAASQGKLGVLDMQHGVWDVLVEHFCFLIFCFTIYIYILYYDIY